ncbi:MAG TPA: hypothetical protein VGB42_08565 [Candidatus Thermoplasmatota archaeon]
MPADALFEYRPARFGPMSVALVFILAVLTPFVVAERLLAHRPEEALWAFLPLLAILLFGYLSAPSPARVFEGAIEVPRSRLARWVGAQGRLEISAIENIFPSFYEDAGMRFSPFASAEGTAKHAGVRIETKEGRSYMLEFTPAVLNLRKKGTPAYHEAVDAVRAARRGAGLPMVGTPPRLTDGEAEAMLTRAARPLLPFPVTVAGVLAPALVIPLLLWAAGQWLGAVGEAVAMLVALVGLIPLIAVFAFVNVRSRGRARLLHEVQKWREHRREAGDGPAEG